LQDFLGYIFDFAKINYTYNTLQKHTFEN
jgi:hypothetical protein